MKNIIVLFVVAIISISIQSCSGFEEQDITQQNNVSEIITQGEWKVNQYLNNNLDETNVFSEYTFQFKSNGTLIARNSTGEISGRWYEDKVVKQVTILFVNNIELEKMNDAWVVNSRQLQQVNLAVSNSSNKFLKIAKN